MATEYISREAMHRANRYEWDGVCGDYDGHQIFIDNENMIDSIPSADVQPIVQGEWIDNGRYKPPTCSNCGSGCLLNYESDYHESDFCPHCGADMKKIIKLTLEHEV